ncbi:MAG: hypothetical protein HQK54_05695 [Oligoflexales bacterium]|nr:hypothetical protein [Oligoflexales bacterium]
MLSYIIFWSALFFVSLQIGYPVTSTALNRANIRNFDKFAISVWIGVILLSNALLAVGLFTSLNLANGISTAISLSLMSILISRLFLKERKLWQEIKELFTKSFIASFILIQVGVAIYVVRPIIIWDDSGLYHLGVIRWLNEYGSVTGLAKVSDRFGTTSAWLALAAPFNSAEFGTLFATFTGGFALFMLSIHNLFSVTEILDGKGKRADWLILICSMLMLPFIVAVSLAISPSPDVPVIVCTAIAAWSMLLLIERQDSPDEKSIFDYRFFPVFIGIGVVSIKLAGLLLLLSSAAFYVLRNDGKFIKRVLLCGVISLFVLLPFLLTNYKTSGCVLFPGDLFCFNVPWHVSGKGLILGVLNFARTTGGADLKIGDPWFLEWCTKNSVFGFLILASIFSFIEIFSPRHFIKYKFNFIFSLIGILIIFLLLTRKISALWQPPIIAAIPVAIITSCSILSLFQKSHPLQSLEKCEISTCFWIVFMGLSGTMYVLWQAPSIRFGLGYGAIAPSLICSLHLHESISKRRSFNEIVKRYTKAVPLPVIISIVVLLFFSAGRFNKSYTEAYIPTAIANGKITVSDNKYAPIFFPYKTMPFVGAREQLRSFRLIKMKVGNFDYFVPSDGAVCWNSPLPCHHGMLHEIKLRDISQGLKAGFVKDTLQ